MSPSELEEFEFRARAEEEEALAARAEPSVSLAPQAARAGMEAARLAPEAANAGANLAKQGAIAAKDLIASRPVMQTVADVAGVATHGVPWGTVGSIARQALDPNAMTIGEMASKVGGAAKQAGPVIANAGRSLGGALVQGAVAPESSFLLPYQMAAYEQEKIRQNPTAPQYKTNPYAQQFRGEAPTQAAAGAMNTRNALIGQQYGGLTPEEQAIMAEERQRQVKQAQARQVLKQPPTSQNFIERSKALADLYGGAR